MADEIARLVVAVDSTSAKAAAQDLDRLTESAGRASTSVGSSFSRIVQASDASLARWSAGLAKVQSLGATSANETAKSFGSAGESIQRVSQTSLGAWNRALADIRADSAKASAAVIADQERIAARMKATAKAVADYRASQNVVTAPAARTMAGSGSFADAQHGLDLLADREIAAARAIATRAAATAAATKVTAAATKGAHGHAKGLDQLSFSSGQAVREYAVLINELQRGDMTRFQGSLMTLVNRVNLTPLLFSKIGIAIGGAVGVMGAFAVAAAKGSIEQHEYNKALALTGDYANTSYDELMKLADGIENSANSLGASREALMAVASSGRFFREEIGQVGRAVVEMSRLTGQSAAEVVKEFTKLKDDPLRAVTDLDKTMHFLSLTTRDQIRYAQEHGHILEASTLAINAVSQATADYSDKADREIGFLVDRWRALKNEVSGVWQAMLDLGKQETITEQIVSAKLKVTQAESAYRVVNPNYVNDKGTGRDTVKDLFAAPITSLFSNDLQKYGKALADARAELEALQKKQTDKTVAAEAASQRAQEASEVKRVTQLIHERSLQYDRGARRAHEIAVTQEQFRVARKALPDDERYSAAAEAREIDAITRRYKDYKDARVALTDAERESKRYREEHQNQLNGLNKSLEEHEALVEAAGLQTDKLSEVERWAVKTLTDMDLATSKLTATEKAAARQRIENIVDVDTENRSRAESIRLLEMNARAVEDLDNAGRTRQTQAEREIRDIGHGGRTNDLQGKIDEVRDRALRERIQLTEKYREANRLGTKEYLDGIKRIDEAEAEWVQKERDYFNQSTEAMSDWKNGARSAIDDYIAAAGDIAGQTRGMWTSAFDGMTDAVLDFAFTSKQSFGDMAKSILMDLARIQLKIALSNILQSIFGGGNLFGGSSAPAGVPASGFTFPNSNGNAFQAGAIIPHSKGGVVSSPTSFPMSGGRTGTMSETEPEAIMPLKRGADGRLGVAAQIGGGGDMNVSVSVSVDNTGGSKETTGGSESQNARKLGEMIAAKTKEVIITEQKQGGLLWRMRHG